MIDDLVNTTDCAADRIRLLQTFDAERMRAEIQGLNLGSFTYYDVLPLRAPAHLVDSCRPAPPPVDDYADGSWTEWLDSEMLLAAPCLLSVVDNFRAFTDVTLVRLLRLEAGAIVAQHSDPTLGLQVPNSVIRLTIPVQSSAGAEFYLNDRVVPMQPGDCWYLRLSDPHRVVNAGCHERINLTIDVIPNDWMRSLLAKAHDLGNKSSRF